MTDDVIPLIDLRQRLLHTEKEQTRVAARKRPRRLVLELHQFEIARNQIEVRDICLADHLGDRNRVFITDRIVERAAVQQVKLRLNPMQGSERSLRI